MLAFVLSNLVRSPLRNALILATLCSGTVTLLLLDGIATAVRFGLEDPLLSVTPRHWYDTKPVPASQFERIAGVAGVQAFTPIYPLNAYYQTPNERFLLIGVDPKAYLAVFKHSLPEEIGLCMDGKLSGMIATSDIASRHGWLVGSRIPLIATNIGMLGGDRTWTFEFCGTFDAPHETRHRLLVRFDYLTRNDWLPTDGAFNFTIRVAPGSERNLVAAEIDRQFDSHRYATRTVPYDEAERSMRTSFADWGMIAALTTMATVFVATTMTACTIMQGFSTRVTEFGTLQTLGFTRTAILVLILVETCSLTIGGVSLGVVSAFFLETFLQAQLRDAVGRFDIRIWTALSTIGGAVLLGVVSATLPTVQATRPPRWTMRRVR